VVFALGYYAGQSALWVAGLKGMPKPTAFQALNALFLIAVGALLIRCFAAATRPWLRLTTVLLLVLLFRHFFLVIYEGLDGGAGQGVALLGRPLMDTLTWGVMIAAASSAGLYTYAKWLDARS
jgi:hypothetical protein